MKSLTFIWFFFHDTVCWTLLFFSLNNSGVVWPPAISTIVVVFCSQNWANSTMLCIWVRLVNISVCMCSPAAALGSLVRCKYSFVFPLLLQCNNAGYTYGRSLYLNASSLAVSTCLLTAAWYGLTESILAITLIGGRIFYFCDFVVHLLYISP